MGRSILHLIDSLDPAAGGPVEFVQALARPCSRGPMDRRPRAWRSWPRGAKKRSEGMVSARGL
jgi:hypothetical protein